MFNAICIQIWLEQGQDISFSQVPGYNLINQQYVCGEHGGLINHLKKKIDDDKDMYELSDNCDNLIDVCDEDTNKKIVINGNIYRLPRE